jgi:hypothetical protein
MREREAAATDATFEWLILKYCNTRLVGGQEIFVDGARIHMCVPFP